MLYNKWFSENLLAIEMENINFQLNKPVNLGLPILEMSKILMYEIWYDYIKVLCYLQSEKI